MSVRDKVLTRTRCPACDTVFRVTSDQLRLKAGMVRCGQCKHLFNAFDHLMGENAMAEHEAGVTSRKEPTLGVVEVDTLRDAPAAPSIRIQQSAADDSEDALPIPEVVDATVMIMDDSPMREPVAAKSDEPAKVARDQGLLAARSLDETPAYNRWAAGALATESVRGFDAHESTRPLWPFVLSIALLFLVLGAQGLYQFRTDLVKRLPQVEKYYALLGIAVPLPTDSALVSIESSGLKVDSERDMFILNAALKNLAGYRQAWPSLELTLTDVNDVVVARRVIPPAEYLEPELLSEAFSSYGETAVQLWIEAREIGAAGYRLYIFYP